MLLRPGDDSGDRSSACEIADVVLLAMFTQQATAALIAPRSAGAEIPVAGEIVLERGQQVIGKALIDEALVEPVLARLAFLCDLDPAVAETQLGRSSVRVAGVTYEILVTLRPGRRGMGAEIRLLDEKGRDAKAIVSEPDGREYPAVLAAGTRVGPYRVLETIGKGGMGVVYLVEHRQLQKRFAMKVLLREVFERDSESSTRFVWEARAAARVQHPGIVNVSDFGNLADGRAFLVMELLSGKSVAEVLKAGGAMDPARAMALIASAADALQAAHAAGVVHRDLTPSNIFIEPTDGGERAKLVDFGAAKVAAAGGRDLESESREPIVFGTPYYMAPEHAQGRGTDARADIYSLGCCLFEMLTGRVPYRARSVREILLKHILADLPEPWSPRGPLPSCVNAVIGRMMAKLPSERYRSAGELSADLRVCGEMLEESDA